MAAHKTPSLKQYAPLGQGGRPRRYTLCTTLRCNLACSYCYIAKSCATMSLTTARRALDFFFGHAASSDNIEIGFFGGEPLLEFPLLQNITDLIESHPDYDPARVSLALTTNGTIFSSAIAAFLKAHAFKVCISCDGPPHVQDTFRRTACLEGTSQVVERTLVAAREALSTVLVNVVYHPQTFRYLPETLDYLSGLGLRRIFLNPDFSANWTPLEAQELPAIYRAVADRYVNWYLNHTPHFVSLIDMKIAVLIRGGYHPMERCQMGTGELTIVPDGGIYPCERLIGSGADGQHRIGSLERGLDLSSLGCRSVPGTAANSECCECTLRDSCMNWCGCSNFFMTGDYDRVGPFLCASERVAIQTALDVFATLERQLGPVFLHHLAGEPDFAVAPEKLSRAVSPQDKPGQRRLLTRKRVETNNKETEDEPAQRRVDQSHRG